MSSSDRMRKLISGCVRAGALAGAIAVLAAAAGCTVQPIYGNVSSVTPGVADARVASIDVRQVDTREAQEVRNHLIFLLNGGAGQPADPRYTMELEVLKRAAATATVQIGTGDNEPSAGAIELVGTFLVKDAKTQRVVARGNRAVTASFDRPRQLFAEARAERDAVNRAARELAEFIRLAVLQDLRRMEAQ